MDAAAAPENPRETPRERKSRGKGTMGNAKAAPLQAGERKGPGAHRDTATPRRRRTRLDSRATLELEATREREGDDDARGAWARAARSRRCRKGSTGPSVLTSECVDV